ncbi:N-6 DNA methylase [Streptomyces sp. CB03238]|uniref:N-6 DNA methylase n=1 Tax=Streptomyces sp. CB03238 TaxID=1907777 RepID=UPI001F4D6FA1|nr:N-6 DNA methylase [Streptomyces sp. CB03238]
MGASRGGAGAEDSAALKVFAEVRHHRARLSRLMNAHDSARLVLGLLYLSRTAHAAPRSGVATWSWLQGKAAERSPRIGAAVSGCLAHWLAAPGIGLDDTGTRDSMPVPPPGADDPLRGLILAISSAQQVGALLDLCLSDLSAEQARGSHYFTPSDMARLMVGAAAPQDGHSVLDPVCGSGGLLAESHRYVRECVGLTPAMTLRGRDQHAPTSQVARMNLSVRGIKAHIFPPGDSLAEPEPDPYDIILANLPFNQHDWVLENQMGVGSRHGRSIPSDPRWPEQPPPKGSGNVAWILHIAHALAPRGRASFLMADSVAKSSQPSTQRLRERLLRADLVECVIALPPRVFGHTDATACLWVLNKDKQAQPGWGTIDRRGQVLFINARRSFERVAKSSARRLGDVHTARMPGHPGGLARCRGGRGRGHALPRRARLVSRLLDQGDHPAPARAHAHLVRRRVPRSRTRHAEPDQPVEARVGREAQPWARTRVAAAGRTGGDLMTSAAHRDSTSTEAWQATAIADFHPKDMYTTSGLLDDDAPEQAGIVSSTHVRDGRIQSPRTGGRNPGDSPPSRATLKEGDLAVVLVRRTGDTAVVTAEYAGWTATRSIGIIRAAPHVVRWLRIWLQTPTAKARIDEDVTAHVEPTVSLDTLRRMQFPLPPPDVVATYHRAFSLLEELITLHGEAARDAVELADAINDDWCSTTAAWEKRPLREVAKAKTGTGSARALAPHSNSLGVDAITPTDLFGLTVPHVERFRLSSPADATEVWPPGTFMLSTRPDGAHIAVTQHPATPTRCVLAVRPVDDTDGWWLLHELRNRSSDITQAAQGRNAREISARAFSRLSVTWPDSSTRARFHALADPLHTVARQLVSKVATLHDLKDALLRDIAAKADVVLEQEAEPGEEHVHPTRPPAIPQPREVTTRPRVRMVAGESVGT